MTVFKTKAARLTSKGQITIPKNIRETLQLEEGDRVIFIEENGKIVVKKGSLVAFDDFADSISREAKKTGVTEDEVLQDLEQVRKDMWNERNS